jgi:hypothetical protein
MASRNRHEFRGRDYQRLVNLRKALQMGANMDVERANWNADEKNKDKRDRVLFAAWPRLVTAMRTLIDRIDVLVDLKKGNDDPGI